MIHALLGLALVVGSVSLLCLALANDDARYLLGQSVKAALYFGGAAVCLAFIVVVVFATKFH